MCPFSNSGENYRSQDKDYREDFRYNSRGLRGQGQLRQGHSMPQRPLGMPNTGNTSWSSERHSTRGTPNPAQHFDDNLPSQLIDEPLIETFIIKDKIREPEVRIVILFTQCYIKLIYSVAILCQL